MDGCGFEERGEGWGEPRKGGKDRVLAEKLIALTVIPAKAGIQRLSAMRPEMNESHWIPAYAGMTMRELAAQRNHHRAHV